MENNFNFDEYVMKGDSCNEKIKNENFLKRKSANNNLENFEKINKKPKKLCKNIDSNLSDIFDGRSKDTRLGREFFVTDVVTLAQNLLGKIIVKKIDNQIVKCKIVETEAYKGPEDKGCHSYNNRRTERTKYFWNIGGCLYIYSIHQSLCLNIVANDADKPEAVLIRAVEPLEGIEKIKNLRKETSTSCSESKLVNLTNGPGKVGAALNITKSQNGLDLSQSEDFYLLDNDEKIIIEKSTRININYAEEYIYKPWRFYIKNNKYVSKAKVEHQYKDD
jgi:DNA-3-methyladenine glycosylase